jgi:hypothetical protein
MRMIRSALHLAKVVEQLIYGPAELPNALFYQLLFGAWGQEGHGRFELIQGRLQIFQPHTCPPLSDCKSDLYSRRPFLQAVNQCGGTKLQGVWLVRNIIGRTGA